MYVGIFPEMQKEAESLMEAFANYPESFTQAFGIDTSLMFTSIEGFLAAEHYSLMWQLMMVIFTIGLGVNTVAKEVDTGTIEVLLAQPVSRMRILISKILAGVTLITVHAFSSVFIVIPILSLYDIGYTLESHLNIAILGMLFGLSVYSITVIVSAILSTAGLVTSISAGVILIMYAANLIAKLQESVENLKWISFFHYFDANKAMLENELELTSIMVFLSVSALCLTVSLLVFRRRDIVV